MASGKSAAFQAAFLNAVLNGGTLVMPASVDVAASLAGFDPDATTSAMSEVTGTAYDRLVVTCDTTNFPAASGDTPSQISNGTSFDFGTAGADWGEVTCIYLLDHSTHLVLWGADLAAPVDVLSGDGFAVPAGQWVVQET